MRKNTAAYIVFFFLLVAFGVIAILPTILSTSWGQQQLLSLANKSIPGSIEADAVHLSWFGPQSAERVLLKDPDGKPVLSITDVSTNNSLFRLLFSHASSFEVHQLTATLQEEPSGLTNLHRALGSQYLIEKVANRLERLPLTVRLNDVNAQFIKTPFSINIQGQTLHDNIAGNFIVKLDQNTLNVDLKHFPVTVIDYLASLQNARLSGLLRSAFGETLDLKMQREMADHDALLDVQAKSSTMQANFTGLLKSDRFVLNQPSHISLTLTPALLDLLTRSQKTNTLITLTHPTQAEILIEELILPWSFLEPHQHKDNSNPIAMRAQLDLEKADFTSPAITGPVSLQQMHLSVNAPTSSEKATLQLQGQAILSGNPTQLNLNADFEKPSHIDELLDVLKSHTNLHIELKNAPLATIEQWLGWDHLLQENLGTYAEITLHTHSTPANANIQLKVASDKLSIPNIQLRLDNQLSLEEPVTIHYQLNPATLEHIAGIEKLGVADSPMHLELTLNKLLIPISRENLWKKRNLTELATSDKAFVDIALRSNSTTHLTLPNVGPIDVVKIDGDLIGNPFANTNCHCSVQLQPDQHTKFGAALGQSIQATLACTLQYANSNHWRLPSLALEAKSNLFQANLQGQLTDDLLVLTEPAQIDYHLTPSSFKLLTPDNGAKLRLTKPAQIHLSINPSKISINQLSKILLSGQIHSDELSLLTNVTPSQQSQQITIQDLNMPLTIDGANNHIDIAITGQTLLGQENLKGTIKGNATFNRWLNQAHTIDFDNAPILAKVETTNLPVALFSALYPYDGLEQLIGKSLNLELDLQTTDWRTQAGTLGLKILSDQLKCDASLKFADQLLVNDPVQPITIQASISPEGFATLRHMLLQSDDHAQLRLLSPSKVAVNIRSLQFQWKKTSGATNPYRLSADLTIDKLNAVNRFQKKLLLDDITISVDSADMAQKIAFHAEATERSTHQANPIVFSGKLENFLTDTGDLNIPNLTVNMEARSPQLPASLFCQIACLDDSIRQKLEALLGETINTNLKLQLHRMNGSILANLHGANGNLKLDSQLIDGVLTLNQPFEAEVAVTPQLGKSVLQDIIPILGGVLGADQPVKINISPKGFVLPLSSLDLSEMQIGQATLKLGKMRFSNHGELAEVFSLLNSNNKKELNVWFTPLYLSMQNGILTIYRMDMLLMDTYPIAIWGKVDPVKDKVNMRIGISASALSQALSLAGIDSNAMLQLPFTGSLGNASIDKTKATAKISALVAQSQGGPHGLIIGTFLDIAGGALSEDKPPPPTTDPLPWATSTPTPSTQNPQPPEEEKKRKKKSERKRVIEQVEGAASSLIDHLLN